MIADIRLTKILEKGSHTRLEEIITCHYLKLKYIDLFRALPSREREAHGEGCADNIALRLLNNARWQMLRPSRPHLSKGFR